MTAPFHQYANIFPLIEGAAFRELVDDVRRNGVIEPIVFLDGAILDGRNRYKAAVELGIDFPSHEYDGNDPLGFVIAKNLHRRHLTESQRAAVAAKLENMTHGGDRKSGQDANLHLDRAPVTRAQASDMLNVSERSVAMAKRVIEKGAPELVAAVDTGKASVSARPERRDRACQQGSGGGDGLIAAMPARRDRAPCRLRRRESFQL